MSLNDIFRLILTAFRKAAGNREIRVYDQWDWKATIALDNVSVRIEAYRVTVIKSGHSATYPLAAFERRSVEELATNFFLLIESSLVPKQFFN